VLFAAKGSQLSLGPSSRIRLRSSAPPGQPDPRSPAGRASDSGSSIRFLTLDRVRGRVEVVWKEPYSLKLELPEGTLEATAAGVRLEERRLELTSGEVRWQPRSGPPENLRAGATLDVTPAPD
jgi:hypothetical protein